TTRYRASRAWVPTTTGSRTLTAQYLGTTPNAPSSVTASVTVWSNTDMIVNLTAPTNNSVFKAGPSITLTVDAISKASTISKVEFYDNGNSLGVSAAAPYSFLWNSAPSGAHQITAKATDALGATTTSPAVAIKVNTLPTVSLTAPAANSAY